MSILSALFDPRGLIVEIAISARVLASSLSGLAWDAAIPRSLAMEVGKWARTAVEVARDLQPRFVRPIDGKIFVFVDASTTAHGTCVVVEDGNGELRRLYAKGSLYKKHNKSWVSVSSKIELLALKQGVVVGRYLKEMFEGIPGWSQAEMIFGTDNETNFNRIASGTFEQIGERWERFNAVEVNNIMVKLGATIFHVPGSSNPADSVSRGVWEAGSSKMREAVNWFNRERAAVPRKFVLARVTACEARVAAVQRTSDQVMMEEIRESESLTERYMREGQGKSRSEWILSYQERDGACMELVYSKRAVMINGVWTFPHRQALDASVLPAVIVPKELIKNALVTLHERGGHLGARKAAARGRDTFWWRKMGLDLKRHVMTCPVCQSLNGTPLWKSAPGRLYAEGRSWSVVGIDFVKGMDKPILTVTCLYTRYLYAFPLSNEKASTVCETLRKLFCVEGAPSMIVSDNAQNFTSEELAAFLKKWNVVLRFIPRYSPWYGGGYEAGHRTLMKTLAAVVSGCSTDWKKQLAEATFYYNCRPYELAEDTALSPQEVFRGRRMINPWRSATMETDDPWPSSEIVAANIPELLAERDRIAMDFEETWKRMRTASMEEIRRRSKRVESFEVGEAVYVWIPPLLREGKLGVRWEGPYRISEVRSPVTYMVGNKLEHVKNLKRAVGTELLARDPPSIEDISGDTGLSGGQTPACFPGPQIRMSDERIFEFADEHSSPVEYDLDEGVKEQGCPKVAVESSPSIPKSHSTVKSQVRLFRDAHEGVEELESLGEAVESSPAIEKPHSIVKSMV
jgi:hypothetical protein